MGIALSRSPRQPALPLAVDLSGVVPRDNPWHKGRVSWRELLKARFYYATTAFSGTHHA
jgi:hypothetical protein